jgi:hypothetical protein
VTYRDLRPDDTREVQVLHDDGAWYTGELEAYRKTDGVWAGRVRYSVAVGAQHIGWFTEDRLKAPDPQPPGLDQ